MKTLGKKTYKNIRIIKKYIISQLVKETVPVAYIIVTERVR